VERALLPASPAKEGTQRKKLHRPLTTVILNAVEGSLEVTTRYGVQGHGAPDALVRGAAASVVRRYILHP